ncbi:MAG: hypothetical protein QF570_10420 [Myxococcota bacterium]|jgi:hypothetical protein|nr:hypothetical protein [Myxococcota bacterium]
MASKMSDFWIRMNSWVLPPFMNLPLHWILAFHVMLIRFRGTKSGKEFTIPVAYRQFDDCLIILLTESRDRKW